MSSTSREHRSVIGELKIPPMPQTLLGATEMMQADEDVDVAGVLKLVEHDPAVVARVLRIANSAYYGQSAEITATRRAIVVLGPPAVLGLVMSMGLAEMKTAFDQRTIIPFLNIVRHSIATAYITQELCRIEPGGSNDCLGEAFTAGLLHDIGKMALLYTYPEVAAELYLTAISDGQLLTEEERLLGTTHVAAGASVADRMRLPTILRDVICHHHLGSNGSHGPLTCKVRSANQIAHALGFPEKLGSMESALYVSPTLGDWTERRDEIERYVDAIV